MQKNISTRRVFLQKGLTLLAVAPTIPTFLDQTVLALANPFDTARTQQTNGKDGKILVVVQLAGGNDGLNTVVPYADDAYHRARPRLALPDEQILTIDHYVGLNPKLAGLKSLYEKGHLAILQGVGYPNPNRSHFRSTVIWQTASDAHKFENYGWLGRYFDNCCAGADPAIGVNVGRQMPQAFAAKNPIGISLNNPENYRLGAAGEAMDTTGASLRQMNRPETALEDNTEEENAGGSIGAVSGLPRLNGSVLDYIERTALDAQVSSDEIH